MVYMLYDGSFEGLFTAIFEVYERRIGEVRIRKQGFIVPGMFSETIAVHTDEKKAFRVLDKLRVIAGSGSIELFWRNYLSEYENLADPMLAAIRYTLKENANILTDYGDPDVLRLRDVEKQVRRERHRMTAFVRFRLGADDLYYAVVEPDFDVLPLITGHFESRYADQRWLIYDAKRRYGIYYDLEKTAFVQIVPGSEAAEGMASVTVHENEEMYELLWKDYFRSTGIPSRKNMKLHLQHVPRRYWKYLTEKKM